MRYDERAGVRACGRAADVAGVRAVRARLRAILAVCVNGTAPSQSSHTLHSLMALSRATSSPVMCRSSCVSVTRTDTLPGSFCMTVAVTHTASASRTHTRASIRTRSRVSLVTEINQTATTNSHPNPGFSVHFGTLCIDIHAANGVIVLVAS